jgi:hypothetical protein
MESVMSTPPETRSLTDWQPAMTSSRKPASTVPMEMKKPDLCMVRQKLSVYFQDVGMDAHCRSARSVPQTDSRNTLNNVGSFWVFESLIPLAAKCRGEIPGKPDRAA